MDLFAHRIHKADYVNGCVRLECSIVRPDDDGKYHPDAPVKPEDTTFSVNLPLQGFMRSMGVMRELVGKLQEDGTLKGRDKDGDRRRPEASQLKDLSEEDRSSDDDPIV